MTEESSPSKFMSKVRTKSISRLNSIRSYSTFSQHRKTSSSTTSSSSYCSYSHNSYSSSLSIGTYIHSSTTATTTATTASTHSRVPANQSHKTLHPTSLSVSSFHSRLSVNSYNAFPDIDLWSPSSPTKSTVPLSFGSQTENIDEFEHDSKISSEDDNDFSSLPSMATLSAPKTRHSDLSYDRKNSSSTPPLTPTTKKGDLTEMEMLMERNIYDDYQNSNGFEGDLGLPNETKYQTKSGSHASYNANYNNTIENPVHQPNYAWINQRPYHDFHQHKNPTPRSLVPRPIMFKNDNFRQALIKNCPSLQSFRSSDKHVETQDFSPFFGRNTVNQRLECAEECQNNELDQLSDAVEAFPFLNEHEIDDPHTRDALYHIALSQDRMARPVAVAKPEPTHRCRKRDRLMNRLNPKKWFKNLGSILLQKV